MAPFLAIRLDARQFVFVGFLPRTAANRKALLESVRRIPFTLIFYEAPHRLKETLSLPSPGRVATMKRAPEGPFCRDEFNDYLVWRS